MFIGVYTNDNFNTTNFNIYYKCGAGYEAWYKDTFSPATDIIGVLDFTIKGNTYEEKKDYLEDLAKEYQLYYSQYSWSYGELAEICDYFNKMGKRYGLLGVFRENGIC